MSKVGYDKQVLVLCTIVHKCCLMQANPLLINRNHYNGNVAAHKVTHWLKLALACDGVRAVTPDMDENSAVTFTLMFSTQCYLYYPFLLKV